MTATKKFIVRYPVTIYCDVAVERPENITEEELLKSITRNELADGDIQDDCAWDSLKDRWRDQDHEAVYTFDEDDLYEEAFPIS